MTTETTPRFDLEGRIVLVTGAARGIGRACALASAGAGADVIVGVRKTADGEELRDELQKLGRRAAFVEMDLIDLDTVRSGVAAAEKAFGRIDVLVTMSASGRRTLPKTSPRRISTSPSTSTSRAPSSPPRRWEN